MLESDLQDTTHAALESVCAELPGNLVVTWEGFLVDSKACMNDRLWHIKGKKASRSTLATENKLGLDLVRQPQHGIQQVRLHTFRQLRPFRCCLLEMDQEWADGDRAALRIQLRGAEPMLWTMYEFVHSRLRPDLAWTLSSHSLTQRQCVPRIDGSVVVQAVQAPLQRRVWLADWERLPSQKVRQGGRGRAQAAQAPEIPELHAEPELDNDEENFQGWTHSGSAMMGKAKRKRGHSTAPPVPRPAVLPQAAAPLHRREAAIRLCRGRQPLVQKHILCKLSLLDLVKMHSLSSRLLVMCKKVRIVGTVSCSRGSLPRCQGMVLFLLKPAGKPLVRSMPIATQMDL